MAVKVGIDLGTHSIKWVALENHKIIGTGILQVEGRPMDVVRAVLVKLMKTYGEVLEVGITGTATDKLIDILKLKDIPSPTATVYGMNNQLPEAQAIIEMGNLNIQYLKMGHNSDGSICFEDIGQPNKCAAASGSFLNSLVRRFKYESIDKLAELAFEAEEAIGLSGRCAVFLESDVVGQINRGNSKDKVVAGVNLAIVRSYLDSVGKGKSFEGPVAFIGGLSFNRAMVKYLEQELEIKLQIPNYRQHIAAIGAAIINQEMVNLALAIQQLDEYLSKPLDYPSFKPLDLLDGTIIQALDVQDLRNLRLNNVGLGLDIGSISTKGAIVAQIDNKLVVLASYYRRTEGDPLEAVRDVIHQLRIKLAQKSIYFRHLVACTTGSGRYLTADFIGADLVRNEITAQASGARAFCDQENVTIFEIGGQDSKYVRLEGDDVVDYEMNKACAAGTGGFLERLADILGVDIEEFGKLALGGTKPPEFDSTCTVFTEAGMVLYQQQGVDVANLAAGACIAAIQNYLDKTVGSRKVEDHVLLQGAVFFNQGMVAAVQAKFEGKKILVSPQPHLTGAIGAARIALHSSLKTTSFRGFEAIEKLEYTNTSFECKKCANRCMVSVVTVDGKKYYYNDRCEKYSGINRKNDLSVGLPDLFSYWHKIADQVCEGQIDNSGPFVGIPKMGLLWDKWVFYRTFFQALGCQVILSQDMTSEVIGEGLEKANSEPCFPFKAAHGAVLDLVDQGVEAIFLPNIISSDQMIGIDWAQSCAYWQCASNVINEALHLDKDHIKILSPNLHFARKKNSVREALVAVAAELNIDRVKALTAFEQAIKAQCQFQELLEDAGKTALADLPSDGKAVVVLGRPYTLRSGRMNMEIGSRIQKRGVLAIPQDFLPLGKIDISDRWSWLFSKQLALKMAAAQIVNSDPRLRAIVVSYYACGPDSFGNPFFRDELEQPCYVMQIDEHTSDANVETRIEAFLDSKGKRRNKTVELRNTVRAVSVQNLEGKILWIPDGAESAPVLAAAMRLYDVNARVLPRSKDKSYNTGKAKTEEDVCLPWIITMEDILYRINQPDFDPEKEAFFQGNSNGPCRFGFYCYSQRHVLDKMDLEKVEIFSLGIKERRAGLGIQFALLAWDGFVACDKLFAMLLHTRPYEINKGESYLLFERKRSELLELLTSQKEVMHKSWPRPLTDAKHLAGLVEFMQEAQREFEAVPKSKEERPLVGLVGEFFVRLHSGANQEIIAAIEELGGEVWFAPLTEFFVYANYVGGILTAEKLKEEGWNFQDWLTVKLRGMNSQLAFRDEEMLSEACLPYLAEREDKPADQILHLGEGYLNRNFGGEAICSMGKSEDYARNGVHGIVNIGPMNCIPTNIVTAMHQKIRRRHSGLPFLTITYNGGQDTLRRTMLRNFMEQVKARAKNT